MAKKNITFIVFEGNGEIIVTTPAKKEETIKEYFNEGNRDIEEYDVTETTGETLMFRQGPIRFDDY